MTAATRELLDKAYLASINFAGKVCLEMFHNGPSADSIDAWEALRDAYDKLQETES